MNIKAIALDLDDTLIDTSGLLAPKACLEAFSHLIANGLGLDLSKCEQLRLELIKRLSHRDVFEKLAQQYGSEKTLAAVPEAISLFYEPHLPTQLPLLEGAAANLEYLKNKYPLYLVTAGAEKAQMGKVRALGIESDFRQIFVVDNLTKKRKKDVFLQIISEGNFAPENLLCIGNSVASEIKDALSINALACYFEFGEDRGSLSSLPRPPHFHIRHHAELVGTCHL